MALSIAERRNLSLDFRLSPRNDCWFLHDVRGKLTDDKVETAVGPIFTDDKNAQ